MADSFIKKENPFQIPEDLSLHFYSPEQCQCVAVSSFVLQRGGGQSKMIMGTMLVTIWINGLESPFHTEKFTFFQLTHQRQPYCLSLQKRLYYCPFKLLSHELAGDPRDHSFLQGTQMRVGSGLEKHGYLCSSSTLHCSLPCALRTMT